MLNKRRRRHATFSVESLDDRVVLSTVAGMAQMHEQLVMRMHAQIQARNSLRAAEQAQLQSRLEAHASLRAAQMNHLHLFSARASMVHGANVIQNMQITHPGFVHFFRAPQTAINFQGNPSLVSNPASSSQGSNVATQNQAGGNTKAQVNLPANTDQTLNQIYQDFVNSGSSADFTTNESVLVYINGSNVGIVAHGDGSGSLDDFVSALTSLGMQVQTTDAKTETVTGMIPISKLPNAAQLSQTFSIGAMYKPRLA